MISQFVSTVFNVRGDSFSVISWVLVLALQNCSHIANNGASRSLCRRRYRTDTSDSHNQSTTEQQTTIKSFAMYPSVRSHFANEILPLHDNCVWYSMECAAHRRHCWLTIYPPPFVRGKWGATTRRHGKLSYSVHRPSAGGECMHPVNSSIRSRNSCLLTLISMFSHCELRWGAKI